MDQSQKIRKYQGEDAKWPYEIPLTGWIDIIKRSFHEMKADNVQIVAAGVAFYFFLSIFPTIIAAISVYSLVLEPDQIREQISKLSLILPEQSFEMIKDFLEPIIEKSKKEFGWGLAISVLVSIWSANQGTSALLTSALNFLKKHKALESIVLLPTDTG